MARIADEALETIRQRVDIAELAREYVPDLKRAGRNFKARCPFHQEKTPSFMVNTERQIFHCFGCQEGGDVFTFLMKMEGLGFSEAVEKLAQRVGVSIAPAMESLGPRERELLKIREALAFACDFYRQILEKSPEAVSALRYLDGRGLNPEIRERFGLGFALADGSSFLEAALRKGFSPEILLKGGLAVLPEGRGRYRDFFRGRIIYPVRGTKGYVIGFGARAMGDAMPKYLNSPETPVFSKSQVLYGLHEGLPEIRKARKVILMEGYMDVIAAHQFGIHLACAPLGTAVTEPRPGPDNRLSGHAGLFLKRYVDEAVMVFDPDNAGATAALRGTELLLQAGLNVRIATIPEGLDPDEYLHKHGAQAFGECLKAAKDLPDFQTSVELARLKGGLTAETKDRIAREVLAVIAKADSEILKAEWVKRLAERLQVHEVDLRAQMSRQARSATSAGRHGAPSHRGGGAARGAEAPPEASLEPREKDLLQAILRRPDLALDANRINAEDFDHPAARRIFERLSERLAAEGARRPEASAKADFAAWSGRLLEALLPEDAALARAFLVAECLEENLEKSVDRLVEQGRVLRRYRAVSARMEEAAREGCSPDAVLREEHKKLLKRMNDLKLMDLLKR